MSDPFKNLAWDDFRIVKAIADARGMTGAAINLRINHSTVFRRLGQIEEALGTSLFERHRTGYSPTPACEEMVALASRLDSDITAFTRRIAGQEITPHGELRVTTNDTLAVHLLMPILAAFRAACPGVRLDLVVSNQALNLSKRDADVAIRATFSSPPDTLVGRRLAPLGWALYGRRDEALNRPEAAVAELASSRDWVSLGDNLGHLAVVQFTARTVPTERIACRVDTVIGLAEAIESGIGIGYLPCFIGDQKPGLARLAAPDPAFTADLWILTHPDLRHAARIRAFIDFTTEAIAKRRALLAGEQPSQG